MNELKYFYEISIGEIFCKPKKKILLSLDSFEKQELQDKFLFISKKKIISINKKIILDIKFKSLRKK